MDLLPLRSPVSSESPCGADLENNSDPRWGQLNNLAAGEKREGITYPPKWKDVAELALEVARETRHLRLGVILTECATFLDGLTGLRDGLSLIRYWCENFWEDVYPAGELEDKRDFRPPVVEAINYPSFLVKLLAVPVSQSAGGRFSIGDLEIADNPTGEGDSVNNAKLVQGGFKNTNVEILKTAHTALIEALEHAKTIEGIFDDKFGSGYGVNLADLRDQMSRMAKKIAPYCGTVVTSDGEDFAGADGSGGDSASFSTGGGGGIAVNSRESAIKALDKIISWFETNEPSNPVPFLLRRAQRCANMNFFELITELANDRAQAETILAPYASAAAEGESS